MENKKIKEVIKGKIDNAVEAPIHDDQRDIEAAVLATRVGGEARCVGGCYA